MAWVGLPSVGCWSALLSGWGLGVGGLLLPRVGSLALGAIVWSLALGPIPSWSLLSIGSHLQANKKESDERAAGPIHILPFVRVK